MKERGLNFMSQIEWFKNEVELANEFLAETVIDLAVVEAYDAKIALLKDKKAKLAESVDSMWTKNKIERLDQTIVAMEEEVKKRVIGLQHIKESYMANEILFFFIFLANEIIDTIETLSSAEEGEELSDEACEVLKNISLWMRKYCPDYIL